MIVRVDVNTLERSHNRATDDILELAQKRIEMPDEMKVYFRRMMQGHMLKMVEHIAEFGISQEVVDEQA